MIQTSLRVLIADDSDADRRVLTRLLQHLGYQVRAVRNGAEAVDFFRREGADMVLLDALMPVKDGMAAAREIKAMAGERLVPVIFLTALTAAEDLARCLEAGGDGFLSKPYNRVMLQAKLAAFDRMRRMHQTLAQQNALICEHNRQLLDEQAIARRVFDNIAHRGCLDAPNIRYRASPLSIFNGDVLLASPRPDGGMLLFLGDFAGHGLPAAIGAMPVAEIFYSMATKGFSGMDVLREINKKLRHILPVGMFCCGAMVEMDAKAGQLGVWNGGLPEGWLIRRGHDLLTLPSRHLPLGIRNPEQFDAGMEWHPATAGDTLLLMTDGVLRHLGGDSEVQGLACIRGCLQQSDGQRHPFDCVEALLAATPSEPAGSDDLTLCALDMIRHGELIQQLPEPGEPATSAGPMEWCCTYEIRGPTLSRFNPLPLLLHICREVPGLRACSGEVFVLLSELYSNALEHGVLQLPSEWKHSRDGFAYYYGERQKRLAATDNHCIRFCLSHRPQPWGGSLRVICEDTGPGFDHAAYVRALDSAGTGGNGPRYAGRGLRLLQRLARKVTFHGKGNRVEIVYDWRSSSASPATGKIGD